MAVVVGAVGEAGAGVRGREVVKQMGLELVRSQEDLARGAIPRYLIARLLQKRGETIDIPKALEEFGNEIVYINIQELTK